MRHQARVTGFAVVAVLLSAGWLAAGCGGSDSTAVRVTVSFAPGLPSTDQLRVAIAVASEPLTSNELPAEPGAPLRQGADLVIRFPGTLGGDQAHVVVAGLFQRAQVGAGETRVRLVTGQTVTAEVILEPVSCPADEHDCDGTCYPDDDDAHCGLLCLECLPPESHGTNRCAEGICLLECAPDYTECDGDCVDLLYDGDHCAGCNQACAADEVCQEGTCRPNPCPEGAHPCGPQCVSNDDPAHCGSRCDPCPEPPSGTATCDGKTCGVACAAGFHDCLGECVSDTAVASCGTSCTPCPEPPSGHGSATCVEGTCGLSCDGGYHACDSDCVSDDSPEHCGASCEPCPAPPANGEAVCLESGCAIKCDPTYRECDGKCLGPGEICGPTWTRKATTGPEPRSRPGFAFDSTRGVVVLFGGYDGIRAYRDTWEWDGSTWTERTPSSPPSFRSAVAMAYDPVRQETVMFGGESGMWQPIDQTWVWDGTYWTPRFVSGPEARGFCEAVWNPATETIWLFGGVDNSRSYNDVWEWDGSAWDKLSTTGSAPPGRANAGVIYDPTRGHLVVHGGEEDDSPSVLYGDTYILGDGTWGVVSSTDSPSKRAGMGFVFDRLHQVGVLFGGYGGPSVFLGDTWVWDGTWVEALPPTAPGGRWRHVMAFDSIRNVAVMFGGASIHAEGNYYGDTWELSF